VSRRRLLVVTYYYPPQPGSGSNRWAAMVKYLRRLGHEVTVITAAPPGHAPGEDREEGVVRTGNLNSNPLLRRLLLRAERTSAEPPTGATANGGTGTKQAPGGVMPPLLWKGIVPDPWLATWVPFAWRAVVRELRRAPIDCLITSSPSESTHLLGLMLGRRRPAWIADFRDGWGFEPLRPPFPTPMQRALDRRLEAKVARSADVLVGVTTPIVEDFEMRLGVTGELVTNGFDPELAVDCNALPAVEDGRFTLVHTGALSGPRGRDPRPLLAALRRLLDGEPGLADRLRLVVAGRSEEDERSLIDAAGLGGVVHHLGYVPRAQALALQRNADALLLITSHDRCEATGKLYEYMAASRPILALAQGNEAARIVAETNTGVLVQPDDADAIAGALRAAIDGELERSYAPRGIDRYAYPALAARMAEVIEAATSMTTIRA
jgi:glycosyltransferase involved in cell wall biosynthesis